MINMIVVFITLIVYFLIGWVLGLNWLLRQFKLPHDAFKTFDFIFLYLGIVGGWPMMFPLLKLTWKMK